MDTTNTCKVCNGGEGCWLNQYKEKLAKNKPTPHLYTVIIADIKDWLNRWEKEAEHGGEFNIVMKDEARLLLGHILPILEEKNL